MHKISMRLTALLLAFVMLITSGYNQALIAGAEEYVWGSDVELSGYSTDLYIFNTYYRTGAAGEIAAITDSLSMKTPEGQPFGYNIFIGDYPEYTVPGQLASASAQLMSVSMNGSTSGSDAEGMVYQLSRTSVNPTAVSILDIPVRLNGLAMASDKVVHINEVNAGSNRVLMFVSAASVLQDLVLEKNAILELTLDADMTIGNVTLGSGSRLIIHNNGYTCSVSSIVTAEGGTADVEILGNGTGAVNVTGQVNVSSLSVEHAVLSAAGVNVTGNLTLENSAYLDVGNGDGAGGSIIVGGDINVDSSTVGNASLFGYNSTASGIRTIKLQKASFDQVDLIGAAADCTNAVVRLDSTDLKDVKNTDQTTYFISDYKINYGYNGSELSNAAWPVYYRARTDASFTAGTILGSSLETCIFTALEEGADGALVLPDYTQEGYGYQGWLLPESETAVFALQDTLGDQTLTAQLAPGVVAISWVLNYEQGEYTNPEDELEGLPATSYVDKVIELKKPSCFGQVFNGWKITSGEGRLLAPTETSYQIMLSDLDQDENGSYQLKMETQWKPDKFELVMDLSVGSVLADNIRISGKTIAEYVSDKQFIEYDGKTLTFTEEILYGESLSHYFARVGLDYTSLTDVNQDLNERKRFVTWTYGGTYTNADTLFALGENGLLKKPDGTSLEDFRNSMQGIKFVLIPLWATAEYKLYFDQVPGWSFWVDGEELTSSAEGTVVTVGKTITMKHAATEEPANVNLSQWKFGYTDYTNQYFEIPQQKAYQSGDDEICFTFTMPTYDIGAAYCGGRNADGTYTSFGYTQMKDIWGFNLPAMEETFYVDLTKSPITFAEDGSYAGISGRTGFWYNDIADAMTPLYYETFDLGDGTQTTRYFYGWDFGDAFYVTTSDETTNQLTVVNAMTIYLKNVEMVARQAYSAEVVGRKLGSLTMEKMGQGSMQDTEADAWADYGNIIMDNVAHPVYTTTLYFEGSDNTVAAMFQKQYKQSKDNKAKLVIAGDADDALYLGSVWGNLDINVDYLNLGQYDNIKYASNPDRSEYLLWTSCKASTNGTITFNYANVNAPGKRVFSGFGYLDYNSATVELGSSRHSYHTRMYGTTYIHLLEDSYGYYYGFIMNNKTSLVLEGSFYTNGYETGGSVLKTTGFLIAKGNFFDAGALEMSKGTLIANAVGLSSCCTISGSGKIVTNQLVNMVNPRPSIREDGSHYFGTSIASNLEQADDNGDDLPFLTFSNKRSVPSTYSFSGGQIYLLGYYQVKDGRFDASITTETEGNPMAAIIGLVQKGEGYSVSELTDDVLKKAVSDASATYRNNECLMFGNSSYKVGSVYERTVTLTGTAFYAAGNMNFYNETVISAGSIDCAGKLSSKHDLTISGGTITASEIGNSCHLTDLTADNSTRWKKVSITGGTIVTGRVGALSVIADTSATPRSTVELGVTISPRTDSGDVQIVHDVYVNYIYDKTSDEFLIPENNPTTLRFTGTLPTGGNSLTAVTDMKLVTDDLIDCGAVFEQPALNDGNQTAAKWLIEASVTAPSLTRIDEDTIAYSDDEIITYNPYDREQLPLYIAKGSYTFTVYDEKAGIDTINDFPVPASKTISVAPDAEVKIDLTDASMAEKMVIWYYDDNGILHNVLPAVNDSRVTFKMPLANAEIWVTDDLKLYLDLYDITFTDNGFIVAEDATRADSIFKYKGNLTVKQSNTGTKVQDMGVRGNVHVDTIRDDHNGLLLATDNQLFFAEGSGNRNANGLERTITLEQIMQSGTGSHYGVTIPDGEKVELTISGAVQLYPIYFTYNSDLKIVGKTSVSEGYNQEDTLYFRTTSALGHRLIGSGSAACGNVTLENLRLKLYQGHLATGSSMSDKTLHIKDCLVDFSWYAYCILANNMENVIFEGSDICVAFRSDTGEGLFSGCKKVLLKDTKFDYTYAGGRHGTTMFYGMEQFVAEKSEIKMYIQNSTSSVAYYERLRHTGLAKTVTLNDSSVSIDHRAVLNSLVMNGASSFSFSDGAGYLLCPDIEVNDTSTLTADYIVVSGFYYTTGSEAVTESDVYSALITKGDMVLDGNKVLSRIGRVPRGLVVNGGTVNADEFVGGDVNGKVTVSGGVLNAKGIGTSGKLYGYAQYIPVVGGVYVYQYDKIPGENAAVVTIDGGTVNVLKDGYLGGMHTAVEVTGKAAEGENPASAATVILADGTVLGLTKAQESTLANKYKGSGLAETAYPAFGALSISEGAVVRLAEAAGSETVHADINMPYNDITISDKATRVQATNMTAKNRTITICDAMADESTSTGFDNQYTFDDRKHSKVAVSVTDTISAQNIYVMQGAVVYAGNASVEVPAGASGTLYIDKTDDEALAYLYIGEGYGASEKSEGTFIPDNYSLSGTNKNLYGNRLVKITYVLGVDASAYDQPVNPAANPRSFEVETSDKAVTIPLEKAQRFGYEASNWYQILPDGTKQDATGIYTGNSTDLTLYVDWTPIDVRFKIVVDPALLTYIDVASELDGQYVTENTDGTYTYNEPRAIPYHTANLEQALNLQEYAMNTRQIVAVKIVDDETEQDKKYLGDTSVNALTEVSEEMMQYYLKKVLDGDPDPAITLKVISVQQNAHGIWLHLNQSAGLPADAAFPQVSLDKIQSGNKTDDAIRAFVDYGSRMLTGDGFNVDGKLVEASANGYNFMGWFTDKNGTGSQAAADMIVSRESAGDYYAKWEAKQYVILFDAGEGNLVTVSAADLTEPAGDAQSVSGIVLYDQQLNTIDYGGGAYSEGILPKAWKLSHKCVGWGYLPEGETDHSKLVQVSDTTTLNLSQLPVLVEENGDTSVSALTLYPIYEKVTVTYHTGETDWHVQGFQETGEDTGVYVGTVDAVAPLAGYTEKPATGSSSTHDVLGPITINPESENEVTYGIISTTNTYYEAEATKGKYFDGDYRNAFSKKGYTFKGWSTTKDGSTADVALTPAYSDLEIWAVWEANNYILNLNSTDGAWKYALAGHAQDKPVKNIQVTVGEEINVGSDWPTRDASATGNDWFAYNADVADPVDSDKRYILGFTFHSMDPGNTTKDHEGYATYQTYGNKINRLTNADSMFVNREYGTDDKYTEGSTFNLPGEDYANIMGTESAEVPDYPKGSTIEMYALYREVSLVFVMYAEVGGELISNVVHSADWSEYNNYPDTTFKTEQIDAELTAKGLTLLEWKLHDPLLTAQKYEESYYNTNKDAIKQQARERGTYDIMVYTLYMAQVTVEDESLEAGSSPLRDITLDTTKPYTLPTSMLTGFLTAEIALNAEGLNLIPVEAMKNALYDSEISYAGNTYDPDNTVAIALTLQNPSGVTETVDLAQKVSFNMQASKGSVLQMTLYHSRVMTTRETFALDVRFGFDNDNEENNENTLAYQWVLFKNLEVSLQPSLYEVNYYADLLGRKAGEVLKNGGSFDTSTWLATRHSVPYGSASLAAGNVPVVEGYTSDGKWAEAADDFKAVAGGKTINYGETLVLDRQAEENNGKLYLRTSYTINFNDLSAQQKVLDNWTVQYAVTDSTAKTLDSSAAKVEYGNQITLTLRNDGNAAEKAPEYIWLSTIENDEEILRRLDKAAEKQADGSYMFRMPDKDVVLKYNDVMVLYLEKGAITIYQDRYEQITQEGLISDTWPGKYVILMDENNNADVSVTSNTLTLNDDLSGRSIELGDLEISSADSIKLMNETTVALKAVYTLGGANKASVITAENILVPTGSSLTMSGLDSQNGTVKLTPNDGSAAIGGAKGAANGNIVLEKMAVEMTLLSDQFASGIGPGAQNLTDGIGTVALSDSSVTVETTTIAGEPVNLSWIGGENVPSVLLDNTVVQGVSGLQGYNNHLVINGKSVTLQNGSALGTMDNQILNAVKAENLLKITGSAIYQLRKKTAYPITASAIEVYAGGVIRTVYDTASPDATQNNGGLYEGVMKLMDPTADVVINNTLILDTHHGAIVTKDAGALQTQGENTITHSEGTGYLILNEKINAGEADNADVVSEVTVDAGSTKKLTIGGSRAVNISTLHVNAETEMNLWQPLTISESAVIGDAKKLQVIAKTGTGITFTGTVPLTDNEAAYIQQGGYLNAEFGIDCSNVDIQLNSVTADVTNLIAQNMTLTDSTVTAENGQVGSRGTENAVTKVTISGTTTVNAQTIGALGSKNTTFTLVDDSDSSLAANAWWTGTLICDRYRIRYIVNGAEYNGKDAENVDLPTVMRTTRTKSGDTVTEVTDKIPDPANPEVAAFKVWYFVDDTDVKVGLSPEAVIGLTKTQEYLLSSDIAYAVDTDPADETKTLALYAWLDLRGTAYIKSGRLFTEFKNNETGKSVDIQTNGSWTAQVNVKGAVISGSYYSVSFRSENGESLSLPKGTKLTITVQGTSGDSFYGYTVEGTDEHTIAFSSFKKMGAGSSLAPALPNGVVGTEFDETFLLAVDFSGTDPAKIQNAQAKFVMNMNSSSVDIDTVTWSAAAFFKGDVEAALTTPDTVTDSSMEASLIRGTVTVQSPQDALLSGNLYLVGTIKKMTGEQALDFDMPMDSTVTLNGNDISAQDYRLFDGNKILVDLGAYSAVNVFEKQYTWNVEGLTAGNYAMIWNLAVLPKDHIPNVMNDLITDVEADVSYTVTLDMPTLSVERATDAGHTFANTTARTETFRYDGTLGRVMVQKQSTFAAFTQEITDVTVEMDTIGGTVSVTFPSSLAVGVYRVMFSLNDSAAEDGDNVYYTFIVE